MYNEAVTAAPARLGRFEVERELGRGGYGAVYRAFDPELQRPVAIKLLAAPAAMPVGVGEHSTLDLRAGGGQRDALLAEARVMAQLSHPNVLPVYEVGLAEGALFLVMELIAGEDLRRWLASSPRAVSDILAVFVQATTGLAAAHARGIVHRDIKPDNILVGHDGRVRVADFGLAGLVGARPALARVGEDAGTPRYMASELWAGAPATTASDVFALATAMIEALTGEVPGDGPAGRAAAARALAMRQVPAPVVEVLLAAVSDQPAARPRDAGVLLAGLTTRPARARSPLLAGVVLALAGAAGVAAAALTAEAPPVRCDPDPARLVGVWDEARRQALSAVLVGTDLLQPDAVMTLLDGHVAKDTALRQSWCAEAQADRLTLARRRQRERCLDHRLAELGERVTIELTRKKPHLGNTASQLDRLPSLEGCEVLELPEGPAEPPEAARARYARFVRVPSRPLAEREAELTQIESDAVAAGDLELGARAATSLAKIVFELDRQQRERADAALERAYQQALPIRADEAALLALIERAKVARSSRRDGDGAEYAALARQQADGPSTRPAIRAQILQLLGRIAQDLGDERTAAEHQEAALRLMDTLPLPVPSQRLELLADLAQSLSRFDGRASAAVAAAQAATDLAAGLYGTTDRTYADTLSALALTTQRAGDLVAATTHYRAAAAVYAQVAPDARGYAVLRNNLAGVLTNRGELDEADQILRGLLADIAAQPALAFLRGSALSARASLAEKRGRMPEAIDLMGEAVLEYTARSGRDHADTRRHQSYLAAYLLQADQVDAADRQLRKLESTLDAPGVDGAGEVDLLIIRTRIELERDVKLAVATAEKAAAVAQERKATPMQLAEVLRWQVRALDAAGAWNQIAPVATRWRELAVAQGTPQRVTLAEYYLARAAVQLGDAAARPAAQAALTELAKHAGYATLVRTQQAWLDSLDRPPPPPPKPRPRPRAGGRRR